MPIKTTQICIIGSGPAGLLLSQLLHNEGISSIIIDRQSQERIQTRVRAGVLEWGSVEALKEVGVADKMHQQGLPHDGFKLAFDGDTHRIDIKALTGKQVMVYGQTEITRDLINKRLQQGCEIVFSAEDVAPKGVKSDQPTVSYTKDGVKHEIKCDYIAGCDGFHGVARKTIPDHVIKVFERIYPFGWLGILVEKPPLSHELIYASHEDGFALSSMRSQKRSRYYVQVPLSEKVEDWSDQRFWDALKTRLGPDLSKGLQTGDSFEKSIAPLRSFVAEPMRYGNLFFGRRCSPYCSPNWCKGS